MTFYLKGAELKHRLLILFYLYYIISTTYSAAVTSTHTRPLFMVLASLIILIFNFTLQRLDIVHGEEPLLAVSAALPPPAVARLQHLHAVTRHEAQLVLLFSLQYHQHEQKLPTETTNSLLTYHVVEKSFHHDHLRVSGDSSSGRGSWWSRYKRRGRRGSTRRGTGLGGAGRVQREGVARGLEGVCFAVVSLRRGAAAGLGRHNHSPVETRNCTSSRVKRCA